MYRTVYVMKNIFTLIRLYTMREKINRILVDVNRLWAGYSGTPDFSRRVKRSLHILAVVLLTLWALALVGILLACFICFKGIAAKKVEVI